MVAPARELMPEFKVLRIPPQPKPLSERLRELRDEHQLSQTEVAEAITRLAPPRMAAVSQSRYSSWERKTERIPNAYYQSFHQFYGLPAGTLQAVEEEYRVWEEEYGSEVRKGGTVLFLDADDPVLHRLLESVGGLDDAAQAQVTEYVAAIGRGERDVLSAAERREFARQDAELTRKARGGMRTSKTNGTKETGT